MWLVPLFIAVPLIEIALFIIVGGWLTLWPTLALVVATALAGTALIRHQGLRTLEELRGAFDRLDDPLQPLAHGAMIVLAGLLLLTPGFLTDAAGLLLLVPAVRRALLRRLAARVRVAAAGMAEGGTPWDARFAHGEVIEGEWSELRPPPAGPGPGLPVRRRH